MDSLHITPSDLKNDSHLREVSIDIIKNDQEHKHHVEDEKLKNSWSSCCFTFDKQAVMFFSQMFIISLTILISSLGIFLDKEHFNYYINLIMVSVGIIIPNPKFKQSQS